MTLTPKDVNDYKKKDIYHGKTIGAIGNRVKDGIISINNVNYQLEQNEGSKCLHGGSMGLSNQMFEASMDSFSDNLTVTYSFYKKDMLDGLPGNITYKVIYTVNKDNSLDVRYEAISDKDTLFNPTNHLYMNMLKGSSVILTKQ